MNYIETKVKYLNKDGKKVIETYAVDALTFTEAEVRIIKLLQNELPPFTVEAVKKLNVSEVFRHTNEGRWYLVKVGFIVIDEKTAKEKREASNILVSADDFQEAVEVFNRGMNGTMADYDIISISETKLLTVYESTQD